MDTIFTENGIDYIRWTDKEGNIWTATLDEVEVFGKECFEQMPEPEDNLGSWSVEFNLPEYDNELIEVDNEPTEEVIIASRKSFYEWCREQEIC